MLHRFLKLKRDHFFIIWIGLVLVFSACSPQEPVPNEFPDEDEMAEILAELHITESIITHGREINVGKDSDDQIPGYYRKVLDDYNLTTSEFDTIRKWYVAHPYHYQKVYEKMIVYLNRKEAEMNRQIKEEEEQQDSIPEIKDLWDDARELTVGAEDTTDRRLPFSYELDSLVSGSIRLSAFYKFLREDITRDGHLQMITQYADSTVDTISRKLEKTFQNKSITVFQELDSVNPATAVSGFLFDHDTASVTAIEFSNIRLSHITDSVDRIDSIDVVGKQLQDSIISENEAK